MKAQVLVSRNIRRLRVQRRLPQDLLAADANISRTYISRLERGLENPTLAVLDRLANALECDIRDLFDPARAAKPVSPMPAGRRRS